VKTARNESGLMRSFCPQLILATQPFSAEFLINLEKRFFTSVLASFGEGAVGQTLPGENVSPSFFSR
jgi:hypothetical protein